MLIDLIHMMFPDLRAGPVALVGMGRRPSEIITR